MTTSDVRLPNNAFDASASGAKLEQSTTTTNSTFLCPGIPHNMNTTTQKQHSLNADCTYSPPMSDSDEQPCEKYRQFLDSSRQERTFLIEKLVDTSAEIIDSIWHPRFLTDLQKVKVVSTRNFIHEILKRSKTTYSTLQISLFYLFRVKKIVHERLRRRICTGHCAIPSMTAQGGIHVSERLDDLMCCGRRMFLASLMVSSKYLQDKNYRNQAWAKITGLNINEINAAEMAFLKLIDYRLFVSKSTFDKWYTLLHGYMQKHQQHDNECHTAMRQLPQPTTATPLSDVTPPQTPKSTHFQETLTFKTTVMPPSEHLLLPSPSTSPHRSIDRADSGVSFADTFSPAVSEDRKRSWNEADLSHKRSRTTSS